MIEDVAEDARVFWCLQDKSRLPSFPTVRRGYEHTLEKGYDCRNDLSPFAVEISPSASGMRQHMKLISTDHTTEEHVRHARKSRLQVNSVSEAQGSRNDEVFG